MRSRPARMNWRLCWKMICALTYSKAKARHYYNCDHCATTHSAAKTHVRSLTIRATMRTVWTGTASDLLGALAEMAGERVAKSKTWPDSPRALAGRLRRAATFLRKIGIEIGFEREGRARTRTIRIITTANPPRQKCRGARPSASSAPPADRPKVNSGNGFASPGLRTVGDVADGSAGETCAPSAPTR